MRRLGTLLGAIALTVSVPSVHAVAAIAPLPKIAVIVLENTKRSDVVGKAAAPFMNSLLARGKEYTDYHGFKGSPHDYRAMVAGQQTVTKPISNNLFHQFDAEGVDWVTLEESMAGNCGVAPSPNVVPGSDVLRYDRAHDPAYQYRKNVTCKANDRPLTGDAQLRSLPAFSYIVPNNCDNAHTFPSGGDCPAYYGTNHASNKVKLADQWVAHVENVIDPSVTVFVVFDEGKDATAQLVYAAAIGPDIEAGTTDGHRYDHYSFCAGMWTRFGLAGTAPNEAATATPLAL